MSCESVNNLKSTFSSASSLATSSPVNFPSVNIFRTSVSHLYFCLGRYRSLFDSYLSQNCYQSRINQSLFILDSHITIKMRSQETETHKKEIPEHDSGCEVEEDGETTLAVYSEEQIPGKGIGCIALRDIPAGSLVIREVPALYVTPDLDGHAETIRAFAEMEPEDQKELLKLFNLYSKPESEWSASMRESLNDCKEDARKFEVTDVSRETAIRVWQIWFVSD